jgi:hypothetical protein
MSDGILVVLLLFLLILMLDIKALLPGAEGRHRKERPDWQQSAMSRRNSGARCSSSIA